jgi:hypothetical protein
MILHRRHVLEFSLRGDEGVFLHGALHVEAVYRHRPLLPEAKHTPCSGSTLDAARATHHRHNQATTFYLDLGRRVTAWRAEQHRVCSHQIQACKHYNP